MTEPPYKGSLTPPYFVTMASCLSKSALDLTSLYPAPRGISALSTETLLTLGQGLALDKMPQPH